MRARIMVECKDPITGALVDVLMTAISDTLACPVTCSLGGVPVMARYTIIYNNDEYDFVHSILNAIQTKVSRYHAIFDDKEHRNGSLAVIKGGGPLFKEGEYES